MTDQFDGPGSAAGIEWDTLNGRLLLITSRSLEEGINTSFGEKSAVRADITVLDGPDSPEEYTDTLIFPKVIQSQVRSNIGTGRMNLGRLGQGEKKAGQKPPWKLGDPTDADKAIARAYLASLSTTPF